ncbi:methionine--tRNA ligase [Neolewinella lacunae]|uniref:Methionine--tRNA ligase n=1 Tax=Neolewinella lacunae TaxID=1517758 RepID=A0A923PHF1_9BACT|nr:methionine--tRNA ligase [Neolewinella lacunae]MBC6993344.1 methionine--tRNA ligase [Neolewinella lacunae]MDN3636334.1 methionine--tRNA ligase [Neolewinella lacunae]
MRTLQTSALPYANGPLHLGHLAGAYLPADIHARYLRLLGQEVLWVCGSDEHGAAITLRAKKEGISPQAIIDKYHALNKGSFEALGISFDYYHRTSAPLHHATSQDFFLKLLAAGDQFEVRSTEQYYDPAFAQFLADRYIQGTCPNCGSDKAFGDQCENCGKDLSPTDLIDPVSTLSGAKPELRETKHWFFRLDAHAEWLKPWIQEGLLDGKQVHDPRAWKKHVIGQCLSWLDGGLHARSITRDLDWGIQVPLEGAEGKVLYVWFDAPIGYISSTKQWAAENNTDWERWWKGEDSRLIHFIGKDNIVFHCIVFPAMLKAHGEYNLPENVPANQFLNFEGDKFSKSRGWGIELQEYLDAFQDFPNHQDALRWALIRNLPEQQDADFTWDGFTDYHDKDLADKLGNFINRVTVLTHKYFAGEVPALPASATSTVLATLATSVDKIGQDIAAFRFKDAATAFVELATYGNGYLQDAAPWTLYKDNPTDPAIAETLHNCAQIAAALALTATPFIPFSAERLRATLNQAPAQNGDWQLALTALAAGAPLLAAGHTLGEAGVLFPKIIDRQDQSRNAIIQRQRDKLAAILASKPAIPAGSPAAEATAPAERAAPKPEISFDDFLKLDLRTATILTAAPVPKSNKLLQLTIDLGSEQRSVVSGIAQHFSPEEVIGRHVTVVTNLAPRKMAGVLSEAMILMAEDGSGKLTFVSPPAGFGNGWTVR